MITDKELKLRMSALVEESKTKSIAEIIAKAVTLGMKYQEEKIKEGIKIVFENLK